MSIAPLLVLAGFLILLFRVAATFTSMFSRRELYAMDVVTDALYLIANVIWLATGAPMFLLVWTVMWTVILVIDYRHWHKHKDDDDDEFKGRRRSWVRSKLPRPVDAPVRDVATAPGGAT